jgi:hypothetical protein
MNLMRERKEVSLRRAPDGRAMIGRVFLTSGKRFAREGSAVWDFYHPST